MEHTLSAWASPEFPFSATDDGETDIKGGDSTDTFETFINSKKDQEDIKKVVFEFRE